MVKEPTEEEKQEFLRVRDKVLEIRQERGSIGELSEKKLHLTFKYFFQPLSEFHEQKIGDFVADAVTEQGIVEVQTANYGHLREKLKLFSSLVPVLVVCPIPGRKTVTWIDPETGDLSPEHKSPKKGNVFDSFFELSHIWDCLLLPNVTFQVVLVDMKEYRNQNGWSKNRKRGSTRYERIPTGLSTSYFLETVGDYIDLFPPMEEEFTVKELAKAIHRPQDRANTVLYVLKKIGAVRQVGKRGHAYLYSFTSPQTKKELP